MRLASTLAATVAALVATTAIAEACPNFSIPSPFGRANLPYGFLPDPWTRNLTAGGTQYLPNCGFAAQAWVASAPDYEISYGGGGNLSFYVQSAYDTFLLINGPNGAFVWDDDSFGNLNPLYTFFGAAPGVYDIWVGSYQQGRGLPATLYVSER